MLDLKGNEGIDIAGHWWFERKLNTLVEKFMMCYEGTKSSTMKVQHNGDISYQHHAVLNHPATDPQ